jgi:leucyl aminopeptidase
MREETEAMPDVLVQSARGARPVWFAAKGGLDALADQLPTTAAAYARACGFDGEPGRIILCPDETGAVACALMGVEAAQPRRPDPFLAGKLAAALPAGVWRFANAPGSGERAAELAALAFALAAYSFRRYRAPTEPKATLIAPEGVDAKRLNRIAEWVCLGRDLVNTPANDMGPDALEAAAREVARRCGARIRVISGEGLLRKNFPLIHAVGRAASQPPRLVDITWGKPKAPKVTLVGKGVCFDTGGLDIKPSSAMLLMKKDMAGAAVALAAGGMAMEAKLPVRLRLLLPIVENAVSAESFRPGDVYPSRKGLKVEIGNTDAEGRLILADALALADEEAPDLLCDFATLTGAARVALGPDLPPFYCDDETLAAEIAATGAQINDPVWRLPLWDPYDSMLDSKVADLNNVSSGPFAGSITAALFLRRFVAKAATWAHFDIYGWVPSAKPGRPDGGEAQAARLIYELLERRYAGGGKA